MGLHVLNYVYYMEDILHYVKVVLFNTSMLLTCLGDLYGNVSVVSKLFSIIDCIFCILLYVFLFNVVACSVYFIVGKNLVVTESDVLW